MHVLGEVVVWIIVILVLLVWVVHWFTKNIESARGRNRCAYCKSRLKASNGPYARVCSRCGRSQPWAQPDAA